jgi:anti-sigma-K factor RskA
MAAPQALLRRRLALIAGCSAATLLAAGAVVALTAAPRSAIRAPAYLGVLSETRTQRAVLVLSAGRRDAQIVVRTLDPAIHVSGRSLQLWALPRGQAPRSLGVVTSADKSMLRLRGDADAVLGDVTMLAASLEPDGGSPSGMPTGPVLYSGPCVKYW